mgnify:CR=1 FL=1
MGYIDVSVMAPRAVFVMNFLIIASSPNSILNFRGALIDSLISKGYTVHIAVPEISKASHLITKLEKKGIRIHKINFNRTGLNPISDIKTLIAILNLMRSILPIYVLSYTVKPVIYGSIASQIMHIKHFALITGLGFTFSTEFAKHHPLVHFFIKFLYKISLRRTDKIFFQNPDDELLFKKLKITHNLSPTFVVNGSGVDLDYYHLCELPKKLNFLLVARLLESKGVRIYAEAASIIKIKHPNVVFTLVGKIDENPNAISKSLLNEWIHSGDIDYLGHLPDVRGAIANCSVFVLPSYYREGTPRSILEAMSMGRAVITTDLPGCRETVVDGENGYLVKPKSVESLVEALNLFIDKPNLTLSMGRKSREIAEIKYDVHKVNKVMIREARIKDV